MIVTRRDISIVISTRSVLFLTGTMRSTEKDADSCTGLLLAFNLKRGFFIDIILDVIFLESHCFVWHN